MISIPAIRNGVVQGALRLIMEPIFEADFSDSSFGARPGRSAHEAIEKVRTGLRRRRHRVVDVDLSRYFDTIRLPLLAGRAFESRNIAKEYRVAIVNKALARRYFGSTSPIGRRPGRAGGSAESKVLNRDHWPYGRCEYGRSSRKGETHDLLSWSR